MINKNKLKTQIKYTFVWFLILLSGVSCSDDFLDVNPTVSLQFPDLSSIDGVESSLIGTYSILLGRIGFFSDASNWVWGSIRGGDANKGSVEWDQSAINGVQAYSVQSNNTAVLQKYNNLYEGITRANATIRLLGIAQGKVSQSDKNRILAEARFLRGHYYFDLKKNFNNTPYVDENWDEVTPVKNDQDLWPFIEADFLFAYINLPETQEGVGRANKWAAGAYLAKTYLFQNKFSDAKSIFDLVIEKGITARGDRYGLVPYYSDLFRSIFDNNAESIFASQAAAGTGSIFNANFAQALNFPMGGPTRCCGFFQPSLELANSFRTNSGGLPLLDNSYNDDLNAIKTDLGIDSEDTTFSVDEGSLDPRLDHSIGRRDIPYLDWGLHPGKSWIRDQPYGGPYSPKKMIFYKAGIGVENEINWTPGFTAVNYSIIRYADVLLMAAEAEIELNNLDKALEYINRVRTRAKNSFLPDADANYIISNYESFANQEEARTAVRFERKLELSGEGHRFYDLVRWGIAAEVLNAYVQHEDQFLNPPFKLAKFTEGKSEYLPIPQNEIDLQGSDILIQNPGY
jgi:hypothetical protein